MKLLKVLECKKSLEKMNAESVMNWMKLRSIAIGEEINPLV